MQPKESDATGNSPLPFAHTLNGTAAAIPRLIVALLENGAILDGEGKAQGLRLPAVLKPFWPIMKKQRINIEWVKLPEP